VAIYATIAPDYLYHLSLFVSFPDLARMGQRTMNDRELTLSVILGFLQGLAGLVELLGVLKL
jgi:hypothetical protein